MKLDVVSYPWRELSEACLNLNFTIRRDGGCFTFYEVLLVTDEEQPVIIVSGRLPRDIIQRFLQDASVVKRNIADTPLIRLREYFDYGWYNSSRVTRIYPVRDFCVDT
jgi:hypothetical protein